MTYLQEILAARKAEVSVIVETRKAKNRKLRVIHTPVDASRVKSAETQASAASVAKVAPKAKVARERKPREPKVAEVFVITDAMRAHHARFNSHFDYTAYSTYLVARA